MPKMVFKKTLSKTDIGYRMSIPKDGGYAFQIPEGEHSKEVGVLDINGHRWKFRCSTRKYDPYPKPVLSSGWIKFVRDKGLKVGDEVIFSEMDKEGAHEGLQFRIQARKKINLLGQDIWTDLL